MNVAIPARLGSPEGEAWILRASLLKRAFDERADGQYFRRTRDVEDAYSAMTPEQFAEKFA